MKITRIKAIPSSALPEELEELIGSSVDKEVFLTQNVLHRRMINLIDPISPYSFEQVKNAYDALIESDPEKPIHFVIGTPGGCLSSMLGIMNIMLLSKTPCYTYILSEACSAGAWIYLCGQKRFAPKTDMVSFMLHPMSWSKEGSFSDHKYFNAYANALNEKVINLARTKTSIPEEKLKELTDFKTEYFVGNQLFEYGIATDELTDLDFFIDKTPKKEEVINPKKAKKQKASSKKVLLEQVKHDETRK